MGFVYEPDTSLAEADRARAKAVLIELSEKKLIKSPPAVAELCRAIIGFKLPTAYHCRGIM